MKRRKWIESAAARMAAAGIVLCAAIVQALAAMAARQTTQTDPAEASRSVQQKAVAFLKSQQKPDGSWQTSDRVPPAVTALAMRVIAQDPASGPQSPQVQSARKWLLALQREDGGFYRDQLATYNTAITVSALASLNDPALKDPIARGVAFLKQSQWTDALAGAGGTKISPDDPAFGGWNYGGGRGTPDLSNAAIALDALKDSGLKSDDPAYQNALKFVSRLQNHSETNPSEWAGNDGGFIYNPGRNGEGMSSAGDDTDAQGRRHPRSYGSMTYAGLKSMIYAGLTKDDARVKAAWQWISSNWTLEENPGMRNAGPESARAGIYYYYNTLARSLDAYDQPTIRGPNADEHDWRSELIAALAAQQKPDGSFLGDRRWMEDNPIIATSLATLALQDAMRDLAEHPAGR